MAEADGLIGGTIVAATPAAVLVARVAALRARVRVLLAGRWRCARCSLPFARGRGRAGNAGGRDPAPPKWLLPAFLAAAALGALWGWTRPVSPMDAARLADQRLGLRERLSSGLEFAGRNEVAPYP